MILNNINNLIIMTESAAGDALLTGVKHGVKQFGRGLTDIVHLGKFKELKGINDELEKTKVHHTAEQSRINEMFKKSDNILNSARTRENELYNGKITGNITPREQNKLERSIPRAHNRAATESKKAKSASELLNNQYWNFMDNHNARVNSLHLNLPTNANEVLARNAGRGAMLGIATSGIGANTNKEESK